MPGNETISALLRQDSTERGELKPMRIECLWLAPVRNLAWVAAQFGHR
jgi:hypothetical protein